MTIGQGLLVAGNAIANALAARRQQAQRDALLEQIAGILPPDQEELAKALIGNPQTSAMAVQALVGSALSPQMERPVIATPGSVAFDPRTGREIFRVPDRPKPEPLVQIFDPTSPTGTRFVPRSQAAGRPGKPASSLMVEQTPDGTFRVIQGSNAGGLRGRIPAGFEPVDPADPSKGIRPIPGSEQERERLESAKKEQQRRRTAQRAAGIVLDEATRALRLIDESILPATGLLASTVLEKIPSTAAAQVRKLMTTMEANIGFDKLQAMRDASPTGGALGQVSNFEIQLLKTAVGALDLNQPAHVLQDNIKRVANLYLDTIHGPGQGPPRFALSFERRFDVPAPPLDFTMEDVEFTAREEGMTIDEVLAEIARRSGVPLETIKQRLEAR